MIRVALLECISNIKPVALSQSLSQRLNGFFILNGELPDVEILVNSSIFERTTAGLGHELKFLGTQKAGIVLVLRHHRFRKFAVLEHAVSADVHFFED